MVLFFPWSAQVKPETAHVDVLAPIIQNNVSGRLCHPIYYLFVKKKK